MSHEEKSIGTHRTLNCHVAVREQETISAKYIARNYENAASEETAR